MSAKFISDSNISYILRTVKNDLCIKDFNPNREFINSVVSLMKRINNKYNTNDVSLLNQYTIKEITELMRPQYDVESSIQNKYVYTEEDDILRARVTGTTMGKKTKIMGTPIVRKTAEKKKLPKIAKKEKDLKQLFYEGNTVFRPEFSVWENTDKKLFYNQDLDIIYDPKIKKFYDVKTNKELEPGTKYTDTKVFFGLKKSKVIDNVQSGSKLAFYDRNMGDVVSSSIDRDIVTDYNEIQTKEYTISIDSRHRDIRVFPSPSRYTIAFQNKSNSQFGFINNLADQIKGIKRIELVDGIVPNILKAGTTSVPDTYFLLSVEEINGRYSFSSPTGKNIFGKLQFDLDLPINANYLDVEPIMCHRDYYPEPRAIPLTAITISILNFNGNQVSFGQDSFKIRYWQDNGAGQTIITTWLPHQLTTGDLVYFRFTGNPLLDNDLDGLVVVVLSPTLFRVAINSSTVGAGLPPNLGGPPVNPEDPINSSGEPFPTVPPNDPNNPTTFFGFILKPELQNSFTFRIITQEKNQTRVTASELAKRVSGY